MEFEWDAGNTKHLALHGVSRVEFEQVLLSLVVELDYRVVTGEERYKAVGMTAAARLLVVVYTLRNGRIRAVTAFDAGPEDAREWEQA